MAISTYRENLIQTVLDNSYGNTWEEAVNEWEITDCVEDRSRKESCICGKEELKYLYEIHNVVSANNSDYLQKARKYGHFTGYKN